MPVGREAALLLSEGVWPREAAILEACDQLGALTVEQVARAFFNNPRSAYTQLRFLESRRFLARIQVDRATIRLATATAYEPELPIANGRHRRNPVYILDWNGYYLLAERYGYQPRNWNPARAGIVASRFCHSLGISEVWSYLVAAARATHELDLASDELGRKWGRSRLQIGFLNERECQLSHKRAGLRYAPSASKASFAGAPPLYEAEDNPEGRGIRSERFAPSARWQPYRRHCAILALWAYRQSRKIEATILPEARESKLHRWASIIGSQRALGNRVEETARSTVAGYNRYSPRWDPTLHSWECALLPSVPTPDLMRASEGAGDVAYRSLLLEMETGSNHQKEITSKVTAYNRVIRQHSDAWKNAYGIAPRVLVVVRDNSQIRFQARLWRTYSCAQWGDFSAPDKPSDPGTRMQPGAGRLRRGRSLRERREARPNCSTVLARRHGA